MLFEKEIVGNGVLKLKQVKEARSLLKMLIVGSRFTESEFLHTA